MTDAFAEPDPLTELETTGDEAPEQEWAQPWKGDFLKALRTSGVVSVAAKVARVHPKYPYEARKNDKAFAEAWQDAIEENTEMIEFDAQLMARRPGLEVTETRRRVKRQLVNGRMIVVEETEDTVATRMIVPSMTQFLLRSRRPDVYAPVTKHQHGGADGGPVPVEVLRHPDEQRALELAKIALELAEASVAPERNGEVIEDGEFSEVAEDEPEASPVSPVARA